MKAEKQFEFSIGGIEGLATVSADCTIDKQEEASHQGQTLYAHEIKIENAELVEVGCNDESETFPAEWMGELLELGKEKLKDTIEGGEIIID